MSLEKLIKIRAEIEKLQQESQGEVRSVFNNECSKLFSQYPDLISFGWSQFTPYFNDGDKCEFSASTYAEALSVHYKEMEIDFFGDIPVDKAGELASVVKDIEKALNYFNYDDFLFMFGDHVAVKVTRTGVETTDYCHD